MNESILRCNSPRELDEIAINGLYRIVAVRCFSSRSVSLSFRIHVRSALESETWFASGTFDRSIYIYIYINIYTRTWHVNALWYLEQDERLLYNSWVRKFSQTVLPLCFEILSIDRYTLAHAGIRNSFEKFRWDRKLCIYTYNEAIVSRSNHSLKIEDGRKRSCLVVSRVSVLWQLA